MMSSIARFYAIAAKGELDGMKIPEMSIVQHNPTARGADVEVDATYRNLTIGELSDGVLQHQEVGPISVAARGPSANAFEFTIDKVEVDRTTSARWRTSSTRRNIATATATTSGGR